MKALVGGLLLGLVVAAGVIFVVLPPSPAQAETRWQPAPGTSWQWQLSSRPETLLDVDAYDLDGFDTPKATVDRIHASGGKAICYMSVGSWENWRPDKGRFPKRVLGRDYYGWPGEKWLDVRQLDTLAAYRRDLLRYHRYLLANGITEIPRITRQDVAGFAQAVRTGSDGQSPLSPRSAARTVVAVRGLHRFWALEGMSETDPARDVHPPAAGQRLPKAISVDEVFRILEAVDTSAPSGQRDRALLEFLYSTGARISEAVGLDVDDVSVDEALSGPAVVRLFGKGSKERLVPLGSYAAKAIDSYLVRGRPTLSGKGRGGPALFLNMRGGRLSRQSAWTILKTAAEKAEVKREVSPHTLRHSFATHLLDGGADVRVVQELLGHASVTTTQVYTLVTAETLREVYAASHPRAFG